MIEVKREGIHVEGTRMILMMELETLVATIQAVTYLPSEVIVSHVKRALRENENAKRTDSL